jgi:Zn finger protein HypA/HybF involved in hydrogenase expression
MKLTKEECLELGKQYILNYNCYPSAKGWTIASAGCSRDRIYENWNSWPNFITELAQIIVIPNSACITSNIVVYKKDNKCKNCSKPVIDRNTYCSNKCHSDSKTKETITAFLEGEYVGKKIRTGKDSWLRNYLISIKKEVCEGCGIGPVYNGKPLTLEVDHIDGRCFNNRLENLRFLCPNCHSQTPTYKFKNKISDNKNRYKK